jgi:hypothetical protein
MHIEDFESQGTFVAFLDISGFKKMMNDKKKMWKALDSFYQQGYNALINQRQDCPRVEGIFISDSGILFVRHKRSGKDVRKLIVLMKIIKIINERLLIDKIHLTTSIAYGQFEYRNKFGFEGLIKNSLAGYAYLDAFQDTETKPKALPGQCRIIAEHLPQKVKKAIEKGIRAGNKNPFAIMKRVGKVGQMEDAKYYYFCWMAKNSQEIGEIAAGYKLAKESKYIAIHEILQHNYDWIECLNRLTNQQYGNRNESELE